MIKVWVLLIFTSNVPAVDLSTIETVKHAFRSFDECQQARAALEATWAAQHRWAPSRCDEVVFTP